eukprot:GSChrysophyteH1.ASY1.ANO1.811.1 assembled CDS
MQMDGDTEPDLTNVDYEDVLHLYRGWRKSEGALKDKTKELNALKIRVKQLQESHIKFRGQIQALESVKELTVSLQSQLSTVQEENSVLVDENRELKDLNNNAEEMLKEHQQRETEQTRAFRDVQIEFAMLRGRYEEMAISQRELETMTANEQAMRMAAESRISSGEENITTLREENKALRMKLDTTTQRMAQCDASLAAASEQLSTLSREVAGIAETRDDLSTAQAEVGMLKGDIARLLRLMENYPAAKGFLAKWRDSDGMAFIGIPKPGAKDKYDMPRPPGDGKDGDALISVSEVARLQRTHGTDTFPLMSTMLEESEFWVPREAAHIGMNFMASKIPHAPPGTIYEFLRSMNQIWMRRERRKIARVRDIYEGKLADMKRKIDMAKPYKGVMQKHEIQRLKSQVREKTQQKLSGHPRPPADSHQAEREDYELFEEPDTEIRPVPPHERRLCNVRRSLESQGGSIRNSDEFGEVVLRRSVDEVSAEKLLEASLISLETIGRQRASNAAQSSLHSMHGGPDDGSFPTDSYLKGALWIGRNLTLVVEELADSLDVFRNRHLVEISAAAQDHDPRRASHRLNLLAGTGITEALALANTSRMRARNILQGAATLLPGDIESLKGFLKTLPIEAALNKADTAPQSPRQLHRTHAWD